MLKISAFYLSLLNYLFQEGYSSQCNEYLADVDGCILHTNSQCYWNQITSTCIATQSKQIGCELRLNRMSCLQQQLWPNGSVAQCYFSDRCYPASPIYMNKITCNESLSIYACLSVSNPEAKCHWSNGRCQELSLHNQYNPPGKQQALDDVAQRCITDPIEIKSNNITDEILGVISVGSGSNQSLTDIFDNAGQPQSNASTGNASDLQNSSSGVETRRTLCQTQISEAVNQIVCQSLNIFQPCFHGGYAYGYLCIDMLSSELSSFPCDQPGINQYGCQSLNNPNFNCIFRDGSCQFVKPEEKLTCDMILNKYACLSITEYDQPCRWDDSLKKCYEETNFDKNCSEYNLASVSTCAHTTKACVFDYSIEGCRAFDLDSSDSESCETPGLSVKSCNQVDLVCLFDKGCKYLNERELKKEKCDSQLSKVACLFITTPGETCQWDTDSKSCKKVAITQSSACENFTLVNGLTCQMIVFDGCKYDYENRRCIKNQKDEDICSTSHLNIQGCVDITKPGVTCQWDSQQQYCKQIQVIPGVTACSELLNVNTAACSKVSRPESTPYLRNCKYLKSSRGCVNFNQPTFVDKSSVEYVPIDCEEPGLNIYGCVTIDTYDPNNKDREISRCRWDGQQCTRIESQSQIQSLSCLQLQQVNAASCSWVVGKEEYCKYEPKTHNCIPTVNIYTDSCQTPGMNSYGCSALKGAVCYYDLDTGQCLNADDLTPAQYQAFLSKTQCTSNYPSKPICLRITTVRNLDWGIVTQTCQWDKYQSLCVEITTTPKDQCNTYVDINPNTCASIDPKIIKIESYCGYNFTSNSCLIQIEGNQPCATPGFNILSCSSKTDPNAYCYFDYNNNQCMQFGSVTDIKKPSDASKFFGNAQFECRQLNPLGCPLNDWGMEQKCLFDQRCISLDFDHDDNRAKYTCDYFKRNGTYVNKWVCRAVVLPNQYCQYNTTSQQCQNVESAKCGDPDLNINACLAKTTLSSCQWDSDQLQCLDSSPTYIQNATCDSPINIKICSGFTKLACYFDISKAKCQNTTFNAATKCTDFTDPNFAYSLQSCQQIDTQGQFCSYNSQTQSCQTQTNVVSSCNVPGFNKYSCFAMTSKQCYWDKINKQCDDLKDSGYDIYTATCDLGVNKVVCLLIQSYGCRWDGDKGICTNFTVTGSTALSSLTGFQHNSKVCTQMTAGKTPIMWDPVNQTCIEQKTLALYCISFQMNKWACLAMTQSSAFCFWTGDQCSTVQKTDINNYQCSDPVNKAVCVGQTTYACKWSADDKACSAVNVGSQECSNFANSSTLFYSQKVCTNVNSPNKFIDYPTDVKTKCNLDSNQKYPDYCRYNQVTRSCVSFGKYYLKTVKKKLTCQTNTFTSCSQPINVQACRDLTTVECVFISGSGCQSPDPSYTGFTCDQANSQVCLKTATLKQYCTLNDTCQAIEPASQGKCSDAYGTMLVNANACSALDADDNEICIYDDGTNKCTAANTNSLDQYQCNTPGLNQAGCVYKNCEYSTTNTICSGAGVKTCTDALSNPIICAGVRTDYEFCINDTMTKSCVNVSDSNIYDSTCADLAQSSANLNTCTRSIKEPCIFSNAENQCKLVTAALASCNNLNQKACTTQTSGDLIAPINCGYIRDAYQCQQLSNADMANIQVVQTIGDCANLNPTACQSVSILLPCKLDAITKVCQNYKFTTGDATTNLCAGTDLISVNPVVCSLQAGANLYCSWDSDLKACTDVNVTDTPGCTDPGLNINTCIERTTFDSTGAYQACYWNSENNLCQEVPDESFYFDVSCDGMNQVACPNNYNSSYACVWNSTAAPNNCSNLTNSPINCADYTASVSTTTNVSAFVCAYSTDVACAYDNINMKCLTVDTTKQNYEWMIGINRILCLNYTQGSNYYWDQSDHSCNYLGSLEEEVLCDGGGVKQFNLMTCINLKPTCKFNITTLTCENITVDNTTEISVVTDSTIQVGKIICQNFVKGYVAYDTANFICKDISSSSASCTDEGLNRLGCLGKTNQLCLFSESDGCKVQTDVTGRGCEASVGAFNNINLCAAIKVLPCAYYKDNDTCTNYYEFDACSTIQESTNIVTNPVVCAKQTSDCAYDTTTKLCKSVTSLSNGKCNQDGLSKSACIKYTTQNCIFIDQGGQSYCEQDSSVYDFTCTDPVNKVNCLQIVTEDQTCQFDEVCKDYKPQPTDECVTGKLVNPLSCVKITSGPCIYDFSSNVCAKLKPTTLCSTPSINKLACNQVVALGQQCLWDDEIGECFDGSTQYTECTDSVNQGLCTYIELKGQFCYWDPNDNICLQAVQSLTCEQLKFSNVASSCAYASDACVWDKQNHTCKTPTVTNLKCSTPGLSRTACDDNTNDTKTCLYDIDINACILPNFLTKCNQAYNVDDCAGVMASCTWNNQTETCDIIDTKTTNCADVNAVVSKSACGMAKILDPINTCAYDAVLRECFEKVPQGCQFSADENSCTHLNGQPCIWNPIPRICNLVFLYDFEGQYTCNQLGKYATQRTCMDLRRVGEYCIFKQGKCQRGDVATDVDPQVGCSGYYNVNFCLAIKGYKCFWSIFQGFATSMQTYSNGTVGAAPTPYQIGSCRDANVSLLQCHQNLNFDTCINIKTPLQYCTWQGSNCTSITISKNPRDFIDLQTYTLVNPIVCTLVNQPGVFAKYDAVKSSCIASNLGQDNCSTIGLNKAACLNLLNFQCSWNRDIEQCQPFDPALFANLKGCRDLNHVGSSVCQSVQGFACYFDAPNHLCQNATPNLGCLTPGLSYLGCMQVKVEPCEWVNRQCQPLTIIKDLTSCDSFKNPVNPLSCALVDYFREMCAYDETTFKCELISVVDQQYCTQVGINQQLCQAIPGCVFSSGRCDYFDFRGARCGNAGAVHPQACSSMVQPVDTCKFDFLTEQCGNPSINDVCSTVGLNQEACGSNNLCQWDQSANQCRCKLLDQIYPSCESYNRRADCIARSDCYFIGTKINTSDYSQVSFNITDYLVQNQLGKCKPISCVDMITPKTKPIKNQIMENNPKCLGAKDPYGLTCFQNGLTDTCQTITRCEQIELESLKYYGDCSKFLFNGIPCTNGTTTCKSLSCGNLASQQQCALYPSYCVFTRPSCNSSQICLDIQCEDQPKETCNGTINGRMCTYINGLCRGYRRCNELNYLKLNKNVSEGVCNQLVQGRQQCGWVTTNIQGTENICTASPCRYMGSSISSCEGMSVMNQTCVLGADSLCRACEEITDPCSCLVKQPLCGYDYKSSQCFSISCSQITDRTACTNSKVQGQRICKYKKKTNQCVPQCNRLFSKSVCFQHGCTWNDLDGQCDVIITQRKPPKVIYPSVYSTLLTLTLALLIMNI